MASLHEFDTFPAAASAKPEAFQLHVFESRLGDLMTLLKLSPIGPPTWENSAVAREQGKYFGVTRDWLSQAKESWLNKFDWRAHEARINSFPNFKVPIQDGEGEPFSIHFAALFSTKTDAVPVIFLHGWPGCFLEFLPMLDILRTKYTAETLPFHAIVPSLPGYGLSSGPPLDRDFSGKDAARILNKLMVELGFGRGYVTQGGDVGYMISRILNADHDECKAMHVNTMMPEHDLDDTEGLDETELRYLAKFKDWQAKGAAYALEHGTRPATIGLVMAASPLALLAWTGEKYLEWSNTDIPLDTILAFASLYWFTSSMPRNVWPYRNILPDSPSRGAPPMSETKPVGYSAFRDIYVLPKVWTKRYPMIKFRKEHNKGGHFAALEQPEAFLADVHEFLFDIAGPL
ncbi:epoxide hydrolase 1 [Coniella lustricola]|uniref:Epoxide hydrolase 1 n=1 Tax=Coniella lustricola TaxID=2025994 RepID=A0A2T2ZWF7_9PEZI|nr:epoxide hydrolase 1 [Coniella lustricola]